ncbi:helix-turn-helix transcriptional regulator [Taibaiella chishuiensis]|uniref:Regulatory LuxR family protein n=1 Tax=Taibaiella chishuiensis TaxID=1434707 RepID=A0A2P8D061_9BACT|nr:helix-turn-helix transcriptional regulator [Taibaiella chishuiensis]PSK90612.1 regulatory LuxR family protein [Taibaiella chishuiensis]
MKQDLQSRITQKLEQLRDIAADIPGVVIVHKIPEATVEFISPRGLDYFGVSLEAVKAMGADYYPHFFNPEEASEYVPKIMSLIEQNDPDMLVSFFQQVHPAPGTPWTWHYATTKILMQDDDGRPVLSVTVALPVDPQLHITHKVSRLLDENVFLRQHYREFATLTEREKEVLKHLTLSLSAAEIAELFSLSVHTVETHRKNIKKKLGVSTTYDLSLYARAFDLI